MCILKNTPPYLQDLYFPLASCVALAIAPPATATAGQNYPLALSLGFTVINDSCQLSDTKLTIYVRTYCNFKASFHWVTDSLEDGVFIMGLGLSLTGR